MAATLVNNNDQINIHQHQTLLTDTQIFSVHGEENENEFDRIIEIENIQKESLIKPPEISIPSRPWSEFSIGTSSIPNKKSSPSRSYKFIQLERALKSTNLLKTNDDKIKFENDYLISLNENKFDEFLHNYYQKIHNYNQYIKQEQELKKARAFTFINLDKNFFSLDPTRDIKIIFLDEPISSTITKTTNSRSNASAHQKSPSSDISTDAAVESFYVNQSHRLLSNPSRARDEITLFARRTVERLQERLPRLSSVPHRVKIVDERDIAGKPDERTLLQMKHKRTLSLITKRRHLVIKMMTQNKKNQIKMEQQWKKTPLTLNTSVCCQELLERANQIEQDNREEQIIRPQTAIISRKIPRKNISFTPSDIMTTDATVTPTFSSCSTPFQDSLSIHHIEQTKNIRIISPTRPLTAPTKVNWVNYC